MEETTLIQALRAGSEKALGQIYDRYAADLLAFCHAWTKSREDAEEIVQDTFMRLWDKRADIRNGETLRPLLFTIARHAVIDRLRQRVENVVFEDYVAYRDSHVTCGEDSVDYGEYEEMVRKAITRLTPAQRKIVWLSDIKGLDNHAIAGQLGISEKTVRNQLSDGNKHLRDILTRILRFLVFFLTI